MTAPVLAVGDGALGFWKAVRDVFPETAEQRCWWHKIGNVLAALPKSVAPGGEEGPGRDLQRRGQDPRPRRGEGVRGRVRGQVAEGGGEDHRRPRRVVGVLRLPGRALDPPADDEPDRVDLRDRAAPATRHQGPRLPGRRGRDGVQADRVSPDPVALVNAPHLVALVRAGATFVNGKLVERPTDQDQQGGGQQAA